MEYASERRRHKIKSFSHIGTRCAHFESRVDFWKSNRSRVGKWSNWNLGNWRGRQQKQKPSHKKIQTRRRESKDSTILVTIVLYHFAFHLLKGAIIDLKWNETTKYLAASSYGGWITVKFYSFDANLLTNGNTTVKKRRHWSSLFPPFVSDLVDGQRRARPQFEGRFFLLEFGLASEWENERRRWRNRRRKEIKGKLDNRLVSDVI